MKRTFTYLLLMVAGACCQQAFAQTEPTFKELQYEALTDMTTARRGHTCVATASGDILAVGGHTTGFSLTATAERLTEDGLWTAVSVGNAHDGAANATLPDGRVLLCGGMGYGGGSGQTAACSIYDPTTATFTATADLRTRRAFVSAVPTGEGNNVLVSGNWYNTDTAFELWDGTTWTSFGSKTPELNRPYMVSAGEGIVYVFGSIGRSGAVVATTVWKVDTKALTVETLTDTGLEDYTLGHGDYFGTASQLALTADGGLVLMGRKEVEGVQRMYLLRFDVATAKATELAILPASIPDVTTGAIEYAPGILVNQSRGEAYVVAGYSAGSNLGLAIVNYNLTTKDLTVYHTENAPGCMHYGSWTLQPTTGRLIITGGTQSFSSPNYSPIKTVLSITPYGTDTGVETLKQRTSDAAAAPQRWYTLDGRRVSQPARGGLYVDNLGRKVVR